MRTRNLGVVKGSTIWTQPAWQERPDCDFFDETADLSHRAVRNLKISEFFELELLLESHHSVEQFAKARTVAREDIRQVLAGKSAYEPWMQAAVGKGSIDNFPHSVARVDLTISDKVLTAAFLRWLKDARNAWQQERERVTTMPAGYIKEFARQDKQPIDTREWARMGLLPCMDLGLNADVAGVRLTNPQLAEFLGRDFGREDTVRRTVRARAESFLYGDGDAMRYLNNLLAEGPGCDSD